MASRTIVRARELRLEMTEEERLLWWLLRRRRMKGFRFRRQQPLGPFIVDFVCLKARLVVELDGVQHLEERVRDQFRDSYLESQGFKVLRFWNNEVWDNQQGVLERIQRHLE